MPWRKGNRLRTVPEHDADPATRRIYDEIKSSLALPGLQLYYPALGVYPAFLALHWQTVSDAAKSPELHVAAERLRADAYTRAHNYFRIPNLSQQAELAHSLDGSMPLLDIANYFHYRDPLLLLLFTYQIQAMEGQAGKARESDRAPELQSSHAWPERIVQSVPPSISEVNAPPAVKKKFEEFRRTLGVPFVSPDLCAFAGRPEFLDAYWSGLKLMLASPLYPECKHGLRTTAWQLAAQLPGPAELTLDQLSDAGLSAEDVASVARILELFVEYLSGGILNVSAAKIAIEGGNLITTERAVTIHDRDLPAA